MAYLEPERVEVPPAVQQSLRDAHARLGGTACPAKKVAFLCFSVREAGRIMLNVDQEGRVLDATGAAVRARQWATTFCSLLRHARVAGTRVHAHCRDVGSEEVQVVGHTLDSEEMAWLMEWRVWVAEGLVWQQRQQRQEEEGRKRWERRGASGRRGRRRREPGVVFELGPRGEQRRALSHAETAQAIHEVLRKPVA